MNQLKSNTACATTREEYAYIIQLFKDHDIMVYCYLTESDFREYPSLCWTNEQLSATRSTFGGHNYNWVSVKEFLTLAGITSGACDYKLLELRKTHNNGKRLIHTFI